MKEILLSEYKPQSELRARMTLLGRASTPAIDSHNHMKFWVATGRPVSDLLRLMDELNIEKLVNIAGLLGDDTYQSFDQFEREYPHRFITIGTPDLTRVARPDFPSWVRGELRRMKDHGLHGVKVWKTLGLDVRDDDGRLVAPDDERLTPLWQAAAELGLPVVAHLADPAAFFKPIDAWNERYEELQEHPDWSYHREGLPGFADLLAAQERLVARESATTFILAHAGACAEDLTYVGRLFDRYPNVSIDISARIAELGRQPYTAREFFLKYPDRILYGLDSTPNAEAYRLNFRFLETFDEYFPYSPDGPPSQGRWHIYGIGLPPAVLAKVYRENALRLFPGVRQ